MNNFKPAAQLTKQTVRSFNSVRSRVVDALIIETPDLSFYVRLQNLVNYLLDCVNREINRDKSSDHLKQIENCLNHLEMILKNGSITIGQELFQILENLLEEGRCFQNAMQTFSSSAASQDPPFEIFFVSKSTQIQWLSVCLLEEIKKHILQSS